MKQNTKYPFLCIIYVSIFKMFVSKLWRIKKKKIEKESCRLPWLEAQTPILYSHRLLVVCSMWLGHKDTPLQNLFKTFNSGKLELASQASALTLGIRSFCYAGPKERPPGEKPVNGVRQMDSAQSLYCSHPFSKCFQIFSSNTLSSKTNMDLLTLESIVIIIISSI